MMRWLTSEVTVKSADLRSFSKETQTNFRSATVHDKLYKLPEKLNARSLKRWLSQITRIFGWHEDMVKTCVSSMQGQPAKLWIFMVFASLLLATVIAIRPLEKGSARKFIARLESVMTDEFTKSSALGKRKEEAPRIESEEECEKNEEKEECLNRRSLAAHTDYIYTQKDKDP